MTLSAAAESTEELCPCDDAKHSLSSTEISMTFVSQQGSFGLNITDYVTIDY